MAVWKHCKRGDARIQESEGDTEGEKVGWELSRAKIAL